MVLTDYEGRTLNNMEFETPVVSAKHPAEVAKQSAFVQAYEHCHTPFIRYCTALGYGKMDTEDLVQDVLLSAYQHFEKIKEPNKLLHYLVRAARNRAVSRWRKRKYRPELLDKHAQRLQAKGVSPEQLADVHLVYQAIRW